MSPLNEYFDHIVLINLRRRADRLKHAHEQFRKHGIENLWLFDAYDKPLDHSGRPSGNYGCTASHRGVLEIIAFNKWPRTLVLEDDFQILHDDFQERFAEMVKQVPDDWSMLYLGGHYGEPPIRSITPNVIRIGRMLTTSSYGITWQMARKMAPYICGVGPIDSLYTGFHRENPCYILEPRLVVQYSNLSDLTGRVDTNEHCMLDMHHVEMLLAGTVELDEAGHWLASTINRSELAAANDMDGSEVIVDGKRYIVLSIDLPEHLPPWRRGEEVVYHLSPT